MRPQTGTENPRVIATIPFVEQLARRVAATMPHSIDIGDLVQDGVIGLIDAAHRFDEARGIKFETFAERRIRGPVGRRGKNESGDERKDHARDSGTSGLGHDARRESKDRSGARK